MVDDNLMKSNTDNCHLLVNRGGSRTAATSKMELFVIIVNRFQPLTIITKCSISDAAAALDLSLVSSCKKIKMEIDNFEIESSTYQKLLGVHFDNILTFDYHISWLCKKASQNINTLARVSQYMNLSKRKILMSPFFDSQFKNCRLCGCVIVTLIIGKLTCSIKDA